MTEHDAYVFGLKVGAVGVMLITFYGAINGSAATLSLLIVWLLTTLFVLPWFFLFIENRVFHIPDWAIRGPHQ